MRDTPPTPLRPCSLRISVSSTNQDSCSGVMAGAEAAYVTIGRPAITTRLMIGSSICRGSVERMRATASLTSLTARSVLASSRNSIVVVEVPSLMPDEMCLTLLTAATASSIGFVTWACSSDGAAPDCVTVTDTIGISTLGIWVTGSERKLTRPSTASTRNSTTDGMGLRIAQAEMLRRMESSA